MAMDSDLEFGMCVVKLLCAIVIAMSLYKMASIQSYNYSYMTDGLGHGHNVRFETEKSHFIGDGQIGAPNFWNMGSVEETNAALQAASSDGTENFSDRKLGAALSGL